MGQAAGVHRRRRIDSRLAAIRQVLPFPSFARVAFTGGSRPHRDSPFPATSPDDVQPTGRDPAGAGPFPPLWAS